MTLRSRLTAAFVLVVLTPLLVGLVLVGRLLPRGAQEQQARALHTSAGLAAQVLRDRCEQARSTAEALARAVRTDDAPAARRAAGSLVDRRLADGARVYAADGRLLMSVGAVSGATVDCATGPRPASAGAFLDAVVPLSTPAGRPAGTAVATLAVQGRLLTQLAGQLAADVALVDDGGAVVAATGGVRSADVRRSRSGDRSARGGRVVAWVPPSAGDPFGVVVAQDAARAPSIVSSGLIVILVAVLLAAGIALLTARAVTAPLDELSRAAARVAAGDLSTTLPVRSRDEVGTLATAFNAMTADLQESVGELQASRDELQEGLARLGATLSSTHDLAAILDVVLLSAMVATRAGSGMVLLHAPGRRELVLVASRDLDIPPDLRVPLGAGISGAVVRTGEAVHGWTGHGTGRLAPGPGEPDETSVIAVPLVAGGRTIGVIDLFASASTGGFGDDDLATMRTFAGQASVAVDNVLRHEEVQRLSVTDGLTGLWNYRYFTITAGKEIERAARFGRPLALLMIDLDHFKRVNDEYGHPRGDAVLIELAARVRSCVRDVDTVARYGGEELVLVLPETDEGGAVMLAERICEAVRTAPFGEGPPVPLTVSVGVAVFPQHGTAASLLVVRADQALYAAKASGRDCWRLAGL